MVCQLAGANLPKLDNNVLTDILRKSRKELQNYNAFFTKLLNTREQLADQEKNNKKYLKAMDRLDEATHAILKKIDTYLLSARSFMKIIGLSSEVFFGPNDAELKQNLAWLFIGCKPGESTGRDISQYLSYATARYRLNLLFEYKEITLFCRAYKGDDAYKDLFFDIFRLHFNEIIEKMKQLALFPDETNIRHLAQSLFETQRLIENFVLEETLLVDEKQDVRDAYVDLIKAIPFESLGPVLEFLENICKVTQDRSREIMAPIRTCLLETCFLTLTQYADQPLAADTVQNEIKKRIHYYAMHYKPQRSFYQTFFPIYVGKRDGSSSIHLSELIQKNKPFAVALLMVFSDSKSMEELLRPDQIANAKTLLEKLKNIS